MTKLITSSTGSGVFAGRIKKPRRYSNVTVTRFSHDGHPIEHKTVAAHRPVACGPRWEPEIVQKSI